jgi:hypothetical protein
METTKEVVEVVEVETLTLAELELIGGGGMGCALC